MTDQEIDFKLALAIGYAPDSVRNIHGWVQVRNSQLRRMDGPMHHNGWQRLDHKDPAVIWPIAERFNCFPYVLTKHKPRRVWNAFINGDSEKSSQSAATACALTVITYCKR